MYYHSGVIRLFQPFVERDLPGSTITAREICSASANEIMELMTYYSQTYGRRRAIFTHAQGVSTAAKTNVVDLSSSASFADDLLRSETDSEGVNPFGVTLSPGSSSQADDDLPSRVLRKDERLNESVDPFTDDLFLGVGDPNFP